jgi:protein-S-isoprenylcysteine O-methyltransferase Ste14
MSTLQDPFFWAFIGMFGLLAGTAAVGGTKLGRYAPLGFLFLVLIEEISLERTLGQPYLDYKQRVKGRIIPGLPI